MIEVEGRLTTNSGEFMGWSKELAIKLMGDGWLRN